MKMRSVAIYARVSTEHEEQLSALENQIQYYDAILTRHPDWVLYDRYIDEGITGTSTKKRKNFMRMMEDAETGKFDLIITREVSRFARNTVDTLQETRKLKRYGVEVWFTEDNIWTMNDEDGELRLTIMATLAQNESKKTSMRVKAGQMISFKNAVPYGTGNILGYDKIDHEYVINPEQADTVRLIFDLYLSGLGIRSIQYEIERLGRLTSTGKSSWFPATISHVLRNPFYCGTMVYRKEYVPDYLEQKKVRNRGEVEQIVVEGSHVPIVTKEEFNRVQERLCKNREHAVGNQSAVREKKDVWSKKMVCSCGASFHRQKWGIYNGEVRYAYQCYSSIKTGTVEVRRKKGLSIEGICDVPMVPQWKMELMASAIFRSIWQDKRKVLEIADRLLEKGYDGDPVMMEKETKIRQLQEKLILIEKKLDALVDMRLSNQIDFTRYNAKRIQLTTQQDQLRSQLDTVVGGSSEEMDVSSIEDTIKQLKFSMENNFDFEGVKIPEEVLEAFIDKVVVYKDKFEWHLSLFTRDDTVIFSQVEGTKRNPTAQVWDASPLKNKRYKLLLRT